MLVICSIWLKRRNNMKVFKVHLILLFLCLSFSANAQILFDVVPTIKNLEVKMHVIDKAQKYEVEANADRDAISMLKIMYNKILEPEIEKFNGKGTIKFCITDCQIKDVVVFLGARKLSYDYSIKTEFLDSKDKVIKDYISNVSYKKTYSPFDMKSIEKLGEGLSEAWVAGFEELKYRILSDKDEIEKVINP